MDDTEPPFVYELSKRLLGRFDVIVLSPYAKGSKTQEVSDGLTIRRFRYMPFKREGLAYEGGILPRLKAKKVIYLQVPLFLLAQLIAIWRVARVSHIDLIHAHWLVPQGLVASVYKTLARKKVLVVATVHGSDVFGLRGRIGTWMKKYALARIDRLAVVSEQLKRSVRQLGYTCPVSVLPMGIDTDLFHPRKADIRVRFRHNIRGKMLLFVGRLSESKGISYLLEALPVVLKEYPDASLLVVGTGVLRPLLEEASSRLNIRDNVIFTGPMEHNRLPELYATCDLFIAPSVTTVTGESEGFGLVIGEAMSCGAAVISSDLESVREMINDNQTGFVVPQRDVRLLGTRIVSLLRDPERLYPVKVAARKYIVDHFDWKVVTKAYEEFLSAV